MRRPPTQYPPWSRPSRFGFACFAWLLTQVTTKTNHCPAHSKNKACSAPNDDEPPVSPSPSALKLEELSIEVINKLMSLGEAAVILKDKAS